MLRDWFISLVRQAVREELSGRLSELEAKTALIESHFANIAVRAKEKQEQQKPQRPRTWSEAKERLEAEPNG